MLVRKILETTLTAGQTSVQFTDSTIPNSLIRVFCNDESLVYTSMSLLGNTLTITYPVQTVNKNIALEIVKAGLTIANDLNTEDATQALSAAQGVALKTLINNLDLEDLYNVSVTEVETGDILTYYGGEWINVPAKNNITDMDDVAVSTIQDGQVLAWDEEEEKFINVNQSGGFSIIYSETEQKIGKWIDGSDLYQKTINIGGLPANTTKNVAHGITNISKIVYVEGAAFRSSSGNETCIPIPSTHYQTIGNQNEVSVNFTNVIVRNGNSSASSFDYAWVTLRYTKTS